MAFADEKERVTIVLDRKLLAELDAHCGKLRMSRSAFLSGLIELGFKQNKTTRAMFGNKFVAQALHLIFGDAIVKQADLADPGDALPNEATDAIRREIIEKIRKLSVEQAEREISRDLGVITADGGIAAKDGAGK